MQSGIIRVADHEGVYVIKMEGDVRLTLCLSFDGFINEMFASENFCSVMFDLCAAQAIDSTTLGLMAKISIGARKLGFEKPLVVSSNPSITRLLVSMGFEDIFTIVQESDCGDCEGQTLVEKIMPESAVMEKVLEAHKALVALNAQNKDTFKELIESLECLENQQSRNKTS
jgi:anti-anti-sigma regulatory factor